MKKREMKERLSPLWGELEMLDTICNPRWRPTSRREEIFDCLEKAVENEKNWWRRRRGEKYLNKEEAKAFFRGDIVARLEKACNLLQKSLYLFINASLPYHEEEEG